jgi:UDP:flavonoid glycosyltransferase YjiC (YdhE family)
MRVLFTMCPGYGHFHPLVPLAQALRDAGHEVAFAVPDSYRQVVEHAGLRHLSASVDMASTMTPEQLRAWMNDYLRALRTDANAQQEHLADVFVFRSATRMVPDLLRIAAEWKPDLLVRDLMEMGACVVAERLGLPCASVQVGAMRPADFHFPKMVARLDELRASQGLGPDPRQEMLYRQAHLCFSPPSYLGAAPLTPTTHYLRTALFDQSGDERLPAWAERLKDSGRPVVYASLGTVVNKFRDPLALILEALRDEPVELVMTVGRDVDPASFGPQPAHVHVERYIPQSLLLPRCDAAILHAGYNSATAALSHGLPLVLLPMMADQPLNALRSQELGAARVLEVVGLTPTALREAVRDVLDQPSYRAAAQRYQREAEALPGLDHAVRLLERLSAGEKPVPGVTAR